MDQNAPSPLVHVERASPLDTLVRRASSRRTKNAGSAAKPVAQLRVPETPPRAGQSQQEWQSPHSPLLHTEFRSSVASTSISVYEQGSYMAHGHESGVWEPSERGNHLRRPQPMPGTREVSMASQYSFDDITDGYGNNWQDDRRSVYTSNVPSVIVSAEELPPSNSGGRVPSKLPSGHSNFSRPAPPPIIGSEEQKRQVLMRNAHSHSPEPRTSPQRPPLHQTKSAPPPTMALPPPSRNERAASHGSVYSNYSYYPYDGALPSPSPAQSSSHLSPMPSPKIAVHPPTTPRADSPNSTNATPNDPLKNPQTAQDYLQLGIQHHLANELTASAACFEKSATLNGGCGIGMLMWGLTQRHGWGVPQSESKGFKWLRRAAEMAVGDLEGARAGMDRSAIKSELVLAIYEVGQSFFRGWGVDKDKQMAVSYFKLAADLGDPDAQQDLAFCLANGKGCKKDRKEAAKWYRAAVKQGVSDIGLAWIYKDKYQ